MRQEPAQDRPVKPAEHIEEHQECSDDPPDEDQVAKGAPFRPERLPVRREHDAHDRDSQDAGQPWPDLSELRRQKLLSNLVSAEEHQDSARPPESLPQPEPHAGREDPGHENAPGPFPRSRARRPAEEHIGASGHDGECDDDRGDEREGLGKGERLEELPLGGGHREDWQETDDGRSDRGDHGAADLADRPEDDLKTVFLRIRRVEMSQSVLADDDTHVHDRSDGDGDAGKGDDVCIDAEKLHCDERHQDRQRQRAADQKRAPQVKHRDDDDDDRHEDFFDERLAERAQGLVDEAGAVVERNNGHPRDRAVRQRFLREPRRDLFDLRFHVLDRRQRIVSVANHGYPADGLGALFVQRAATESRAERYLCHVLDGEGDVVVDLDHALLDVRDALDEAESADDVFDLVDLDRPGADVHVGHLDGHEDLVQGDAVGAHRVRVDVDLVLLHESADGRDLRDAASRQQRVTDVPILDCPQLVQVPSARGVAVGIQTFERVPENLTQGRGLWPQRRAHPLGQTARRKAVESCQDAVARGVNVDVLFEDHVDGGEAEHREGAHGLDAGDPQKGGGQRIGDLIVDVLRGTAHPLGEHDLLVLADVGDGVHRHGTPGQPAEVPVKRRDHQPPTDDDDHEQRDDQPVFQAEADDSVEDRGRTVGGMRRLCAIGIWVSAIGHHKRVPVTRRQPYSNL